MNEIKKYPLGTLKFNLLSRDIHFTGGPYEARPLGLPGIKMAAEIDEPCTWDVPTEDFSLPPTGPLYTALVQSVALAVYKGQTIYVGCMAGRGRTGLFLATLAYLLGEDSPVNYVRDMYFPHAVETVPQEIFVSNTFDRTQFRKDVMQEVYRLSGSRWGPADWKWFWKLSLRDKWLWVTTPFRL